MEQLLDYIGTAKSVWVVWLMGLFLIIVIRTLWPGRKQEMNHYAHIPLEDDVPLGSEKDNRHAH